MVDKRNLFVRLDIYVYLPEVNKPTAASFMGIKDPSVSRIFQAYVARERLTSRFSPFHPNDTLERMAILDSRVGNFMSLCDVPKSD